LNDPASAEPIGGEERLFTQERSRPIDVAPLATDGDQGSADENGFWRAKPVGLAARRDH
jgi:hypothetical protein